MKKGFTLIELLTVMMIMGLMGTIAVGGYRAFQRGMEERGTIENVNTMIRAAYQRAQIDRQPTAVYFWNETVRGRTDEEHEMVVGHAVAVRRHGRFSKVSGTELIDEFADLDQGYPTVENGESEDTPNANIYIYPMDNLNDVTSDSELKRSLVSGKVKAVDETLVFLSDADGHSQTVQTSSGTASSEPGDKQVRAWAFTIEDKGNVNWKNGMAYGFEFIELELPQGYFFGSDYSSSIDDPIRPAGTLVFKPGVNTNSGRNTGGTVGRKTVTISSLRPDGAMLKKETVGETDSPEEKMD